MEASLAVGGPSLAELVAVSLVLAPRAHSLELVAVSLELVAALAEAEEPSSESGEPGQVR